MNKNTIFRVWVLIDGSLPVSCLMFFFWIAGLFLGLYRSFSGMAFLFAEGVPMPVIVAVIVIAVVWWHCLIYVGTSFLCVNGPERVWFIVLWVVGGVTGVVVVRTVVAVGCRMSFTGCWLPGNWMPGLNGFRFYAGV